MIIIGIKITTAQNIIPRVKWLEALSQTIRLEFGLLEEGIRNGNIDMPAVPIIPAIIRDENTKAAPAFSIFAKNIAIIPEMKANAGIAIVIGIFE